jgi:alpha-tubulin suppressor-like RCC1 family protein
VPGEQKLVKISAGAHHDCGIDAAGAAFCWGNQNGDGSLGDGDLFFRPKSTPVRVLGGHTFRDVRAGHGVACGVTNQSEVYCWGQNLHGEAGVTSPSPVRAPERISSGAAFTRVDVGDSHACGIGDAGTVCWGAQGFGQVGGGRFGYGFLPAPVAGPLGSPVQGLPSLGVTRAAPSSGPAPSAALRSEPLPRCLPAEQPGTSPAPGPGACKAEPAYR